MRIIIYAPIHMDILIHYLLVLLIHYLKVNIYYVRIILYLLFRDDEWHFRCPHMSVYTACTLYILHQFANTCCIYAFLMCVYNCIQVLSAARTRWQMRIYNIYTGICHQTYIYNICTIHISHTIPLPTIQHIIVSSIANGEAFWGVICVSKSRVLSSPSPFTSVCLWFERFKSRNVFGAMRASFCRFGY